MPLTDLFEKNRLWAAEQVARDPEFFARHVAGQDPRMLWIGCSDSRVPAEQILNCGPGELFIHRNVANVVAYNDVNIATVIQYAVEKLLVDDIVVCGHYECGGVAAACSDTLLDGYIGDWLMITTWAKRHGWTSASRPRAERPRGAITSDSWSRKTSGSRVRHLTHLATIRKNWETRAGMPRIHGWVYDLSTGLLKQVMDPVDGTIADVTPP